MTPEEIEKMLDKIEKNSQKLKKKIDLIYKIAEQED